MLFAVLNLFFSLFDVFQFTKEKVQNSLLETLPNTTKLVNKYLKNLLIINVKNTIAYDN